MPDLWRTLCQCLACIVNSMPTMVVNLAVRSTRTLLPAFPPFSQESGFLLTAELIRIQYPAFIQTIVTFFR
jgi:hypothetical protein